MIIGQASSRKDHDYILGVRSINGENFYATLLHVFPNVFPPFLVADNGAWLGHM